MKRIFTFSSLKVFVPSRSNRVVYTLIYCIHFHTTSAVSNCNWLLIFISLDCSLRYDHFSNSISFNVPWNWQRLYLNPGPLVKEANHCQLCHNQKLVVNLWKCSSWRWLLGKAQTSWGKPPQSPSQTDWDKSFVRRKWSFQINIPT